MVVGKTKLPHCRSQNLTTTIEGCNVVKMKRYLRGVEAHKRESGVQNPRTRLCGIVVVERGDERGETVGWRIEVGG